MFACIYIHTHIYPFQLYQRSIQHFLISSTIMEGTIIVSNNEDLINKLPDEMLYRIFSYLSYQDAASATYICKRWHDLWNNVTVLRHGELDGMPDAINRFLEHIDDCDPINHPWKLLYRPGSNNDFLLATVTRNWQLNLEFSDVAGKRFPGFFHLSLEPTDILPADAVMAPEQPLAASFASSAFFVKTLCLTSVNHLTATHVSSIVTNFYFLEALYIRGCKGLHSLRISGVALRKASILDCQMLSFLHVNAPKLRCLRFSGARPWFYMDNFDFMLEDAMLDFRRGSQSKHLGHNPKSLLSTLRNVTNFTLCRWSFQEIMTSDRYPQFLSFKLDMLKELWWIDDSVDAQRIDVLLNFLNLCPVLEKLFITIDNKSCPIPSPEKQHFQLPTCRKMIPSITLIKIEGCTNEEEMLLASSLTDAITTDPLIVSKPNGQEFRRLVKAQAEDRLEQSGNGIYNDSRSWGNKSKHAFNCAKVPTDILHSKHAHMRL